jgi:hypothetical protein
MVKRKENPWQFKFSFALAILMLLLVFGYFTQSFLEIRKVKPVSVAIERLSETSAEPDNSPKTTPAAETENGEVSEQ